MVSVTHFGHGVYCYLCQEVYESTDDCDHDLSDKAGVQEGFNTEYFAQPNNMGHHTPCHFMEVDGMEMCGDCEKVKIPAEMVE